MSARTIMLQWVRLNKDEARYYFAKAIDLFLSLPAAHQKAMVEHFVGVLALSKLEELMHDPTRYVEIIRSVLFYYSGRPGTPSPGRAQFTEELAKFIRSEAWTEAEAIKPEDLISKIEFTSELGAL